MNVCKTTKKLGNINGNLQFRLDLLSLDKEGKSLSFYKAELASSEERRMEEKRRAQATLEELEDKRLRDLAKAERYITQMNVELDVMREELCLAKQSERHWYV